MNTQHIQKRALQVFFPAMYLCATTAIVALWAEEFMNERDFLIIPTLFIIGLASLITWVVLVVAQLHAVYISGQKKR